MSFVYLLSYIYFMSSWKSFYTLVCLSKWDIKCGKFTREECQSGWICLGAKWWMSETENDFLLSPCWLLSVHLRGVLQVHLKFRTPFCGFACWPDPSCPRLVSHRHPTWKVSINLVEVENYFMLWNVHLFYCYRNGVACRYLLDMREKRTYGAWISVACEWMLDGLFSYLFGSILNTFSKLNQ